MAYASDKSCPVIKTCPTAGGLYLYSYAPISTTGGEPLPVSDVSGSLRKRGVWAKSVRVPAGRAALSPASMQGLPRKSRKSPAAAFTKFGSELILPWPAYMPLPWTSEYAISCELVKVLAGEFYQKMQFLTIGSAESIV